jgi:NTP pyrophosphatase (non-canonical NTP hydrolase)
VNLNYFDKVNRERCESPDGFNHLLHSWSLSDWFTATLGELGEAANVAKKLNRVRDGIPGNKETAEELKAKLGRELADTFIYLSLTAQAAGIRLSELVPEVFNTKSDEIGCPIKLRTRLNDQSEPPQFGAAFVNPLPLE